jgi:cell division protein FtsB
MQKIITIIRNKYILSLSFFIIWFSFFDRNDIVSQINLTKELWKLEDEKIYFLNQIKDDKTAMYELQHNPQTLEKFAREKYYMKKDNEEIFVIVKPDDKE